MERYVRLKEKFIPTQFGWVSEKTPPNNHNGVVVLIFSDNIYLERIGFYEGGEWCIDELEEHDKICGWSPYPYSPDNN